jgi:ATP-dependent Clp protease ATP-binding subunit ClpX
MEETEVPLRNPMDIQSQIQSALEFQKKGKTRKEVINTRHILFICSGAFDRLREQVDRRLRAASIGFAAEPAPRDSGQIFRAAETQDFVEFGLEPEFVGRLPVRVICEELDANDFFAILKTSEGSVIRQYRRAFEAFGIHLEFQDDALREIAALAAPEKTGARALVTVCERVLRDFKFELPGTGVRTLTVDADLVRDPAGTLARLLAQARAETDQNQTNQVLQFAEAFSQKNGVEFSIEPGAVAEIVARARSAQQEVSVFCSDLFKDYPYGLKLLRDRDRNLQFRFPVSALDDPDKFLSDRVVEFYRTGGSER